jgi:hypothetical protein
MLDKKRTHEKESVLVDVAGNVRWSFLDNLFDQGADDRIDDIFNVVSDLFSFFFHSINLYKIL